MKQKLFLLSLLLLTLFACDETMTVNFDADFVADMDVESQEQEFVGLATKSRTMNCFEGAVEINLDDEDELKDYLDRIREVNVNKVRCEVIGLSGGKKVEKLNIEVDSTSFMKTITDISELSNEFDIDVTDEVLNELGTEFFTSKKLKVKVSGVTSHAPMNFKIKVRFVTKVKASVL